MEIGHHPLSSIDGTAHTKLAGHITLPATVLALAVSIGASQGSKSGLPGRYESSRSADQDGQKAGAINSPHIYTPDSISIACGVIPYDGYEGIVNTELSVWKCNDGAKIYAVKEDFASSRAAEKERIKRLEGKSRARKPWKIEQAVTLDKNTLVELREPVSAGLGAPESNKWVVVWAHNASLFSIYGPDRDHVMDYYQKHHKAGLKR
jgi:hypothetical protein